MRARIVTCLLVAAVVLSACSTPVSGKAMTADGQVQAGKPMITTSSDTGLRAVPPATGDAFLYLPEETAVQVLCQALPQAEWAHLLGGAVTREVSGGACVVTSNRLRLTLRVTLAKELPAQPTSGDRELVDREFAGRPAKIELGKTGVFDAEAQIKLADEAKRRKHNMLRVSGSPGAAATQDKLTAFAKPFESALAAITEALVVPGKPMPDVLDRDLVAYVPTQPEPRGGIVDQPVLVQALQLCTALATASGAQPTELQADGTCLQRTTDGQVLLWIVSAAGGAKYSETVAGRPALTESDTVKVRLKDDVPMDLWVTTRPPAGAKALAEKVVPLLVAG